MTTTLATNVTTVAALDTAIALANTETTAGTYVIDLGTNASIALTQALTAINLHSNVTLDIEGDGATLDGKNESTGQSFNQQGLFVSSGTVTIESLTVENTNAIGAAGAAGGGGGGAGLGGGLFIGATAHVALTGVSFRSDS